MNVDGLKEALDELAARREAAPLIEARMDKLAAERDQYLAAEIHNRELLADRDRYRAIADELAEALEDRGTHTGRHWPVGHVYHDPKCKGCVALNHYHAAIK